jgi:hypothetical protein
MDRAQVRARRKGRSAEEVDWLVAQLADEVDFWRNRAEAGEESLAALQGELEGLYREQEIAEAWRIGLVSQFDDLAPPAPGLPSLAKGFTAGLVLALVLWGLLAVLAQIGYRIFSG